jgi:hypothetical protein
MKKIRRRLEEDHEKEADLNLVKIIFICIRQLNGLFNDGLARYSLNKEKQSSQNRRAYNNIYTHTTITSNENDQYKNLRQIKRFKNSLGIPKFTRNVMDKNNLRNYRLISASPSQNLQQEDKRVKNNEQKRNIEMEIDESYFGNYCKKY